MHERPYQSEAFELYYNLGKNRTLVQVAEQLDYNVGTLSTWSRKFNWQRRIDERDKQDLAIMRRQRLEESEKMRTIYQQAIRQVLSDQFLKPLQNGTLDMNLNNLKDVEKLIKLDMTLENVDRNDERYNNMAKELTEEETKVIEMINADGDVWSALTEKLVEQQNKELGEKNG